MSFFEASKKADDIKQGGSNHITSSGLYPVTILAPIVNVSAGGSTSIDLYLEHLGQKQVIFGNLRISNNDGTPNKIGSKIFNQLMIIANLDAVADPVEHQLPIGKKEAPKAAAVLEDLADVSVYLRIQMEYGVHNGNITEKKVIKGFFRGSDKATAEEIVKGEEIGKGFKREQQYVNNVTYKDGTTPEQIAVWIAAQRPKGTAGNSAPAGSTKAPSFGKKRFGQDDG
ncbi:MAG: hypothetical protein OEX07_01680 [Gammaproteobacteria bacterium]|nr:hypothetical protein [Gammaproteobacteria bacterium]